MSVPVCITTAHGAACVCTGARPAVECSSQVGGSLDMGFRERSMVGSEEPCWPRAPPRNRVFRCPWVLVLGCCTSQGAPAAFITDKCVRVPQKCCMCTHLHVCAFSINYLSVRSSPSDPPPACISDEAPVLGTQAARWLPPDCSRPVQLLRRRDRASLCHWFQGVSRKPDRKSQSA